MSDTNWQHEEICYQEKLRSLEIEAHYKLFSMLRPSVTMDGKKWCVLYGDNIQDGVCGFGDTINDAISEFNQAFYTPARKEQL